MTSQLGWSASITATKGVASSIHPDGEPSELIAEETSPESSLHHLARFDSMYKVDVLLPEAVEIKSKF